MTILTNIPPQAHVPILIGVGLVLVLALGSVASALHADALDMAAAAELRRPRRGRHRLGDASGTPAQQQQQAWHHDDTASFSAAELWEALRAEQAGAGR